MDSCNAPGRSRCDIPSHASGVGVVAYSDVAAVRICSPQGEAKAFSSKQHHYASMTKRGGGMKFVMVRMPSNAHCSIGYGLQLSLDFS